MPEAWRIAKAKHAATAFSGEGAARNGGRWNSRGVPIIYASSTASLAALENLVHLNPAIVFNYVIFHIKIENPLIERLPEKALPKTWRRQPPPLATRRIGDLWVREARSAVL